MRPWATIVWGLQLLVCVAWVRDRCRHRHGPRSSPDHKGDPCIYYIDILYIYYMYEMCYIYYICYNSIHNNIYIICMRCVIHIIYVLIVYITYIYYICYVYYYVCYIWYVYYVAPLLLSTCLKLRVCCSVLRLCSRPCCCRDHRASSDSLVSVCQLLLSTKAS